MIRPNELCAMAVSFKNSQSRTPIGSITARVTPITILPDRSCSVSGTVSPDSRFAVDASESLIPISLISVHTAATAIAPAPINRTSERKTVPTVSARAEGSTIPQVRHGSKTMYEIARPTIIAIPTPMPTRWPTPIRASENEAEAMVPPAPNLKAVPISVPRTFIEPRMAKPADDRPPQIMASKPRLDSSAPSLVSPTFRTSAAATPSG